MTKPKHPQLTFRANHLEFSKFQELKENNVSVRDVIEALCEKCTGIKLYVFKNGKSIEIPSNILSKRK